MAPRTIRARRVTRSPNEWRLKGALARTLDASSETRLEANALTTRRKEIGDTALRLSFMSVPLLAHFLVIMSDQLASQTVTFQDVLVHVVRHCGSIVLLQTLCQSELCFYSFLASNVFSSHSCTRNVIH